MARAWVRSLLSTGLCLLLPLFAATTHAATSGSFRAGRDISITYSEPVRFAVQEARAARGATSAPPTRASFDAYGRRFDLVLESNDKLRARLDQKTRQATRDLRLLRGHLDGLPGSWARLSIEGKRYSGLIWDGRDLYVIAPAEEVAAEAIDAVAAQGEAPVVYRMSDVRVAPGARLCAVQKPTSRAAVTTGLDQYQALVAELRQKSSATLTGILPVSVLADLQFYQANSSSEQTSQNRILSIFNQVDGIFTSQVGVEIEIGGNITVFTSAGTDPFTATTDSSALLDEVGDYRAVNSTLANTGITHLVTGRNLAGSTVGIAYVGSMCENHFSVSLTQAVVSGAVNVSQAALTAAHEIGHNFGAPHDGEVPGTGEPANPCQSTPQTFLMAPALNGSSTFSQCSLDQMAPVVAQAEATGCILPAVAAPDVEALADIDSVSTIIGRTFPISATITNTGALSATGVTVNFAVDPALTVSSFSSSPGLTCANSVGGVACTASAALAANTSLTAQLSLVAPTAGNYSVTATAAATNDTNAANDVTTFSILAANPPDLALELPTSTTSVAVGSEVSLSISARNNGTVPASDAQVQITLPSSVTFVSATNSGTISCGNAAQVVTCTTGVINASAARTISVRVRGATVGSDPVTATLTSDDDGTAGNNSGEAALNVTMKSSSGGGGGGGFDALTLAVLGLLVLWRRHGRRVA